MTDTSKRGRGRPRKPDAKRDVTIKLSPDVEVAWRATGRTIDDILRATLLA